jgi:hypothetical protein
MKLALSKLCVFLLLCKGLNSFAQQKNIKLSSPDGLLTVNFGVGQGGTMSYTVSRNGAVVLEQSRLGLMREDGDFTKSLKLQAASKPSVVSDSYNLLTAKRFHNTYRANKQTFHLLNGTGKQLNVIFQVSNDGLAFRYYFPEHSAAIKRITDEQTSFKFASATKGWIQPMSDAQTGWEHSNPSYEEFYQQGIPVGTPSPIKAGWVFPALFQVGENWALLTETAPDGNYCYSRLDANSPGGEYKIAFPQAPEVFAKGAALKPESSLPWYTPWRIIAVGSLKTIMESTLGTDLAKPAVPMDTSFVKPGKSAWSWVLLKDDSTVYKVQKRFIDYAADMHWQYCLVDADWNKKIGYEQAADLARYATSKQIGLILWYNSAGSWNTTPYGPRSKMVTKESREIEFTRLEKMGVKGLKIDFFGGDGQSFVDYYQDILKDAAAHHLLINFHGATLPRGLQRTYPNLMTVEAIKGMEFRTFSQETEDVQPVHCTTIPFIRNIFDPMDYTPMALDKIPNIKRSTSTGFELALSVVFQSGIQHFAEIPEGMAKMPVYVKLFLQELPTHWDDIRFVDGFPGKRVVIARRSGKKWYVAGINGESSPQQFSLDLSFVKKAGQMISDGGASNLTEAPVTPGKSTLVDVKAAGGFVMVFEE